MARIIAIGPPVNDAERRAIKALQEGLPDHYVVLHNFEFKQGKRVYEIDLAVIAPHGVYLVDAKGTHGEIIVHLSKWYPAGRAPYFSPLLKLRDHAKALKALVDDLNPGKDVHKVYFDAAVILTEANAVFTDPEGKDRPFVVRLEKAAAHFQDPASVPDGFNRSLGALTGLIESTIKGKAKPPSRPEQYGSWVITEKLGGTDRYSEYRARHAFSGGKAATARLRVYTADPYLAADDRAAQARLIRNAYEALSRLPSHPGLVAARDFFPTEEEDRFILVLEDVAGQALTLHLERPDQALTFDQKRRVTCDLLQALAHAHAHGVVHRNLTPSNILVGPDGQARLTGFDSARAGEDRSQTIAPEIADDLEPRYQAPELLGMVGGSPAEATAASDVFSLGLVLYELYLGERPFATPGDMFNQNAKFPAATAGLGNVFLGAVERWLQQLCSFTPGERPSAREAFQQFLQLCNPPPPDEPSEPPPEPPPPPEPEPVDYLSLPPGYLIAGQYSVEQRLGRPGAYGVVYRVIDTLGDMTRALKIVTQDKRSVIERLKKEYKALLQVPPHPNVARVVNAAIIQPGSTPILVFEFADGNDVGDLIDQGSVTPADALKLGLAVAEGLLHLHAHGVYHCDIKPRNLVWVGEQARIIDFNVSVVASSESLKAGGTRRYIPPEYDLNGEPTPQDLVDRDLYALAVTIYETATRSYPWDHSPPPPGVLPRDPTRLKGFENLAPEFVSILLKALSPRRTDRYGSAAELLGALRKIKQVRKPPVKPSLLAPVPLPTTGPAPAKPNTNPFVLHLVTLYSQSKHTNAGTRGLDATYGTALYAETALDRELVPELLAGKFRLVLITGNAGDGKTAFLQTLEQQATKQGGTVTPRLNGSRIDLAGHVFELNHDGSQDEGERTNEDVLEEFFRDYGGADVASWPSKVTRLIAINEGRLIDFLDGQGAAYRHLRGLVEKGLAGEDPGDGVAVVNLNLRSVVGEVRGSASEPLLDQVLKRMTAPEHWRACEGCDLKEKCYARHNALTFQDPSAGPKVIERLRGLYALTHLRGRLHVTLRDLRSALAFMLVGNRDCDEIHQLHQSGKPWEILDAFYFNSWMGGSMPTADRLLRLLRDVDVGPATDPRLDRSFDFTRPQELAAGLSFEDRPGYDLDLLAALFDKLPRDATVDSAERFLSHRRYVAAQRRRWYFERRDEGWRGMWSYRSAERLLRLVRRELPLDPELPRLLRAINRGEGLAQPERFGNRLALQVRQVDRATIRSYRLFPGKNFRLEAPHASQPPQFVEYLPVGLVLRYSDDRIQGAELDLDLDVYEMLERLSAGYFPSADELQGYYLSLTVFKNVLGSASYHEILLTETGQEFYRIERVSGGQLAMSSLTAEGV